MFFIDITELLELSNRPLADFVLEGFSCSGPLVVLLERFDIIWVI